MTPDRNLERTPAKESRASENRSAVCNDRKTGCDVNDTGRFISRNVVPVHGLGSAVQIEHSLGRIPPQRYLSAVCPADHCRERRSNSERRTSMDLASALRRAE